MSRPTQTQAGAFFGILASALMLLLTAMALASSAQPRRHLHFTAMESSMELSDTSPAQQGAVNAR